MNVAKAHRPWSWVAAGVDAPEVEVQVGTANVPAIADVADDTTPFPQPQKDRFAAVDSGRGFTSVNS